MLVDVDKIKDNPLNLEVYGAIVPSDIDTLIESIKQLGLLQPLIITKKRTLISGHRRLACFWRWGNQVERDLADIREQNLNDAIFKLDGYINEIHKHLNKDRDRVAA
jgi:hypothetical protein